MTLAEIIEEEERLEREIADATDPSSTDERVMWRAKRQCRVDFAIKHFPALLAVAKAAVALFAALDHVTPGWREKTCIIDEDSDEVNVAWCGLELALGHESSTPEQIEHALRAAVRGEGKEKATGPCASGHDWIRRGEGSAGNRYVCLRCGEQKP